MFIEIDGSVINREEILLVTKSGSEIIVRLRNGQGDIFHDYKGKLYKMELDFKMITRKLRLK